MHSWSILLLTTLASRSTVTVTYWRPMSFYKHILLGSILLTSILPTCAGELVSDQPISAPTVTPVATDSVSVESTAVTVKTTAQAKVGKISKVEKDSKSIAVSSAKDQVVPKKIVKEKKPFYLNPFKRIAHDSKVILTPLLENVGAPLKATEDNLRALQSPLRNLEEPLTGIKTSVGELKTPIQDLQKPMAEIKQPIVELRKPIGALKQPIADLRKPIADLSKPIHELNVPISHLQRSMNSLPRPIESLVQPLDQLRKPLDGIAEPLSNLEPSVRNLAPPVSKLSGSVDVLQTQVASLSGEMKDLRKSLLDICVYISLAIVLGCAMISGTLIWLIKHFARSYGLSPARAMHFVANPDELKKK